MCYDYAKMCCEIASAAGRYSIINVSKIGKSVMGRGIPCVKIGEGKYKLFLSGAYHGLEYLTAAVLVKFLKEYAAKVTKAETLLGYDVGKLYDRVTLFIAPMINPDGVDIAVNGIDVSDKLHRQLIKETGIQDFAGTWQANARGVDINHNFDALWKQVKDKPSATKYGGAFPESEPETRAVTEFVRKEKPDMLIAFHSQGREIYYDFNGKEGARSREIAEKMAAVSGYSACVPEGTATFGGCKDWFIDEFGKEGFTVEMGYGKNPLSIDMLDSVYDECAKIILCVQTEMCKK